MHKFSDTDFTFPINETGNITFKNSSKGKLHKNANVTVLSPKDAYTKFLDEVLFPEVGDNIVSVVGTNNLKLLIEVMSDRQPYYEFIVSTDEENASKQAEKREYQVTIVDLRD